MPAKKNSSPAGILHDGEENDRCRRSPGGLFEPDAEEGPEARVEKRRGQDEDGEEGDEEEGGDEEVKGEADEEVKRGEGEEEEGEENESNEDEEEEEGESKERSQSSTSGDQSEYMDVDLADVRKDVQCPICLGIIRKTRTVMECLHRFCRECIDKSMRLGNNECPACRKHCASRRSLRDDPKFDALIAALFTNVDQYEEEELAFHEEEKVRNKQIQASIAQISQRQSDALVKRRSFGKEAAILSRPQRSGSGSRRRRNCRNIDHHITEAHDNDDDDDNNNARGKDSSSDERSAEIRHRKRRKRSENRPTHPSTSGANNNSSNCTDNDMEAAFKDNNNNNKGTSPGLVWNPEIFAWGRGGARSSTRHGNGQGGGNKSVRNARLNRLVEYLRSLEGSSVELDIHLKLVPLDTRCTPNLRQPYLCCRPTLMVKQLREFVALQTHLKAEEIELLVAAANGGGKAMQCLEDDETTLARLEVDHVPISSEAHLVLAYRQKRSG